MTNRVLVTGATGFVGKIACETLAARGFVVRAALRNERAAEKVAVEQVFIDDIGSATSWDHALRGVDCVVHAAARAHVLGDSPSNANLYFEANTQGTRRLAEASANAGVRRLVFLSSIKVNGERCSDSGFRPSDEQRPVDDYARSKAFAEDALTDVAAATGLEVAIVRPPLVYGPGVRANFLRLLQWADRQLPLPLNSVHNRRSLVSVWNLCDLVAVSLRHPNAPGRVWMASDGCDVSTPELLRLVATAMGRKTRLWSVPEAILRASGTLIGRGAEVARLCGSLTVDISETRSLLDWTPPVSLEEGLARTVRWYLDSRAQRHA